MAGGRIRSVKFLLAGCVHPPQPSLVPAGHPPTASPAASPVLASDMMLDSPHCTGSRLGGGGEGFDIFSQPTGLYRCARVVSNLASDQQQNLVIPIVSPMQKQPAV
ncbi:TPA: hypothetical protein ACH3X1_007662 [Trebouxia sp. C0004]